MLPFSEARFLNHDFDPFFFAWNKDDVQNSTCPAEQGYILVKKYRIPPKVIVDDFHICSYRSLTRAREAEAMGYDIGMHGQRRKLSRADRQLLCDQITKALSEGQHIYPSTVVQMVFLFNIFNDLNFSFFRPIQLLVSIHYDLFKIGRYPYLGRISLWKSKSFFL